MKTILAVFVIVNLLFATVITGLFVLSTTYPLQPGDSLYGLQEFAVGWRLSITSDKERQVALALELADRRLEYLAEHRGWSRSRSLQLLWTRRWMR